MFGSESNREKEQNTSVVFEILSYQKATRKFRTKNISGTIFVYTNFNNQYQALLIDINSLVDLLHLFSV